jgi:hypothetical protein
MVANIWKVCPTPYSPTGDVVREPYDNPSAARPRGTRLIASSRTERKGLWRGRQVNSLHQCFPNFLAQQTQFLERQSVATHIALLDKTKVVLKRKRYIYLLLNII